MRRLTCLFSTWLVLCAIPNPELRAGEGLRNTNNADPASVVVKLKDTVYVPNQVVLISDIAELAGSDETLINRIGSFDVSDPPQPGTSTRLTKREITFRILVGGVDRTEFVVIGPNEVTIKLAKCTVETDEIVRAARDAVTELLPKDVKDVEIIPVRSPRQPVKLDGVRKEHIKLVPLIKALDRLSGTIQVPVEVYAQGRVQSRQYVTLELRLFQVAPIAKRRIEAGETLTPENIAFRRIPIDGRTSLPDKEQVIGRKARRTIRPLQVVRLADLEPDRQDQPVIRPREVVELVVQRPGLRVTARGESLETGRIGDLIRVRNVDSRAIIVGRVVGPGVVEVRF